MAQVSLEQIKELRARTGAGVVECKKALIEANGDIEKAIEILRKKGADVMQKRAGRVAADGMVGAYLHVRDEGGVPTIGVLVEVNTESDFAARSEPFKEFVNKLCLHIAASAPRWIKPEDVPQEVIEKEKEILREQLKDLNKPPHIIERIIEGKLKKFYEQNCLMLQTYALAMDKSEEKTIEEMLKELTAKIGEKIVIRRFARFEVGAE